MQTFQCLVVDHHAGSAAQETARLLRTDAELKCVVQATSAESQPADMVVLHAGIDGHASLLQLIAKLRAVHANRPLLVVADKSANHLLGAMLRVGASDFVLYPMEPTELLARVRRQLGLLRPANAPAPARWFESENPLLFSLNARFNVALERLPALATAHANVLIGGEIGTGRCAVAQLLAQLATPSALYEFDCRKAPEQTEEALTALTRSLTQIEPGLTRRDVLIILHDVDHLSEHGQAVVNRLGAPTQGLRVRLLATVERVDDPRHAFAPYAELFSRAKAHRMTMPPLRERREDIIPITQALLARRCAELGRVTPALTPAAARRLLTHNWLNGNVIELKAVLEESLRVSHGELLCASDILLDDAADADVCEHSLKETKLQLVVSFERSFVEQLLSACQGNIAKAARIAQKDRRAFFELVRKHEIDVDQYRPLNARAQQSWKDRLLDDKALHSA